MVAGEHVVVPRPTDVLDVEEHIAGGMPACRGGAALRPEVDRYGGIGPRVSRRVAEDVVVGGFGNRVPVGVHAPAFEPVGAVAGLKHVVAPLTGERVVALVAPKGVVTPATW